MAITLANICATSFDFIDEKFVDTVCQVLEIKSKCQIKPK